MLLVVQPFASFQEEKNSLESNGGEARTHLARCIGHVPLILPTLNHTNLDKLLEEKLDVRLADFIVDFNWKI